MAFTYRATAARHASADTLRLTQPGQCVAMLLAVLLSTTQAWAIRVKLVESDGPVVSLNLHVDDQIELELPTQPAAGYRWRARTSGGAALVQTGHTLQSGAMLSASGMQSYSWRAAAPGSAMVELDYSRSFDAGRAPDKSFAIQADVAAGLLTPAAVAGGPQPAPDTDPELSVIAIYEGHLPCADCSGIEERLTIYAPKPGDLADAAYLLRRDYRDAPGRSHLFLETGKLAMQRGTPGNSEAVVYKLAPGPDSAGEAYALEGDRLLPLDAQGVPIPAPPSAKGGDLSLRKVP